MKFDILGKPINLYYKKNDKMRSNFGGFLSVILVLLCGVLIFAFGRNFFQRLNPKIALSTLFNKDYPLSYIGNNNFTLAFRVENVDTEKYENVAAFYFKLFWDKYYKVESGEWENEWGDLNFTRCTKEHFVDQDFVERTDINTIYCANFYNSSIGGFWDGSFLNSMVLQVKPCPEGENNPVTGTQCLPDSEKPSINGFYMSIFTQYNIIDTTNYKPVIKQVIKNEWFALDDRLKKLNYLTFKEVEVISDYGWIIDNKISEKSLGIASSNVDVYSNLEFLNGLKQDTYSEIILYGRRETDIITRNYDKIQTLAAEVGGIIKFIMIIFMFFANIYSEHLTILQLSDLLITKTNKDSSFISNVNVKSLNYENNCLVNNVSLYYLLILLIIINYIFVLKQKDSKFVNRGISKISRYY